MICEELLNLKMKDQFVKNELIYSMQCMIHQYAKRKEGEIIGRKEGEIIGRKEGEIIGRKEGEIIGEERGRKEGEKIGILKVLNDLEKEDNNGIVEKLAKKYGYTTEDILKSK